MDGLAKKRMKIIILIAFTIIVLLFFYKVRTLLIPFLLAFIITYLFDPAVNYFEKKEVPRWLSILGIYVVIGGVIFIFCYYLFPVMYQEMQNLADDLPHYFKVVQNYSDYFAEKYNDTPIPAEVKDSLEASFVEIQNKFLNIIRGIGNRIFSLFGYMVHLVLAPILAFYFLKDSDRIKKNMRKVIPVDYRAEIIGVIEEINKGVHGFIRGQVLDNVIDGALVAGGLYFLGMDYALLIGIMVAIINMIPFLGPIVGGIIASLLSLLESPVLTLKVIILFLIVEQLDNSIINPKLVGDQTDLHPVFIIFALLVGADIAGILGMLLAVPVVIVVKVLLKYGFQKLTS